MEKIIFERENITERYDEFLGGTSLIRPTIPKNTEYNYGYYPVIFQSERQLLKVKLELEKNEIFARRYFYPSLNKLNYVQPQNAPISEVISTKVLCLPLFNGLTIEEVGKISKIVSDNL
jgi:dTDP-4-amino-4,6-dideoxygalactose transaminase